VVLPIIVLGAGYQRFAWNQSPELQIPAGDLKPVCRHLPRAPTPMPMDAASQRARLVARWRAIAVPRLQLALRATPKQLQLPQTVQGWANDTVDTGGNLLGGCEWLLRRFLREQWARLDPAERAQVHALVAHFPLQNPIVEVSNIATNASAWMLFAMVWCGVSHPRSLFQKPLHPPTELVRWVSRFSLEQQTTQAVEIQRRFEGVLRVTAGECGLMVWRMVNRTGQVALLRELCDF